MHIEVLVEDRSGKVLLDTLLPRILGSNGAPHTWRVHHYKGIGRLPRNLKPGGDPAKRILLEHLPRLLSGYARTPGTDAVVVVLDSDRKDCVAFLKELNAVAPRKPEAPRVLFRLAIEEMEAWYFGDRKALKRAYPHAKKQILERYEQDAICGTWELLADAIYPGGAKDVKKKGWPLPGQLKHEWATRIGPHMNVNENGSSSFAKLRDGLKRLIA